MKSLAHWFTETAITAPIEPLPRTSWHIDPRGLVHQPHPRDSKRTRCRRDPNTRWMRSRDPQLVLTCGACLYLLRRDKQGHRDP